MQTDRRRVNPPPGGTAPPVYTSYFADQTTAQASRPRRARAPEEPRPIYLKTSIVPTAPGSAYLELSPSAPAKTPAFPPSPSTLKLTASVHYPRPMPRSAPYTPNAHLACTVKFAPFATRHRRGYIRDSLERDLGAHLESALRGAILAERWPKAGVEICITILEGEEDGWWGDEATLRGGRGVTGKGGQGWGAFVVLAGAITASGAALAEAGIDCVDLVSGGVAAWVKDRGSVRLVRDPCPSEHGQVIAAATVAYLAARDELTEVWLKGDAGSEGKAEELIDAAVAAATGSRGVLVDTVREAAEQKLGLGKGKGDVEMAD